MHLSSIIQTITESMQLTYFMIFTVLMIISQYQYFGIEKSSILATMTLIISELVYSVLSFCVAKLFKHAAIIHTRNFSKYQQDLMTQ